MPLSAFKCVSFCHFFFHTSAPPSVCSFSHSFTHSLSVCLSVCLLFILVLVSFVSKGATTYQPMPQAVVQAGTPVVMAPAYLNQMTTTKAPVMLVPAQNMQQMPGTSGGGLMYVQVPANQVLPGSTQENTSPQVPQVTAYPSGPQSPEEMQVRYNSTVDNV